MGAYRVFSLVELEVERIDGVVDDGVGVRIGGRLGLRPRAPGSERIPAPERATAQFSSASTVTTGESCPPAFRANFANTGTRDAGCSTIALAVRKLQG
jgi:hypothetical protein